MGAAAMPGWRIQKAKLDPSARLQVAETRQLKEEEELKMAETAEDMAKLYFTIEELRAQQGYRCVTQAPSIVLRSSSLSRGAEGSCCRAAG